jgi:hypothetical protein
MNRIFLFIAMLTTPLTAFGQQWSNIFECVDSLSHGIKPGYANGGLASLGRVNPDTYIFVSSYAQEGVKATNYLLLERHHARLCQHNSMDANQSFHVAVFGDKKYRVEIKNKPAPGFGNFNKRYVKKTECQLIGGDSCWGDPHPNCLESIYFDPKLAVAEPSRTVNEQMRTMLKNLVLSKIKGLPRSQQKAFTAQKDLQFCRFDYLEEVIQFYKIHEGLIPAPVPVEQPGDSPDDSLDDVYL